MEAACRSTLHLAAARRLAGDDGLVLSAGIRPARIASVAQGFQLERRIGGDQRSVRIQALGANHSPISRGAIPGGPTIGRIRLSLCYRDLWSVGHALVSLSQHRDHDARSG